MSERRGDKAQNLVMETKRGWGGGGVCVLLLEKSKFLVVWDSGAIRGEREFFSGSFQNLPRTIQGGDKLPKARLEGEGSIQSSFLHWFSYMDGKGQTTKNPVCPAGQKGPK